MAIDWDEEDYKKYLLSNYDILHGFKLKWHQRLWIKFLYWWLRGRKVHWK